MPERIDNQYIKRAIGDLVAVLGVRDHINLPKLEGLLGAQAVENCVKTIAEYMGLPVHVQLAYVEEGPGAPADDGATIFHTTSLARTTASGGAQSITAQVSTPESLPLYGSSQLKGFPIQVKVSTNCISCPRTFVAIMAHELSHVLLRSLVHAERDNEIYTDLTAMLMGFAQAMEEGRRIVRRTRRGDSIQTHTTTFGYLADRQFDFALLQVNALLKKYRGIKHEILALARSLSEECQAAKHTLAQFHDLLAYLDSHLQRRTKKVDASRLVACHTPRYTESLEDAIRHGNEVALKATDDAGVVTWYNDSVTASLRSYKAPLENAKQELCAQHERIRADCRVLQRNVGFFARRRLAKERKRRQEA